MNQVKIDAVDNGFVVSLNKTTPTGIGTPPKVEVQVKVFTELDKVLEWIKAEA